MTTNQSHQLCSKEGVCFKVTSENLHIEKVVTPSPILQNSHNMQMLCQHSSASLPPSGVTLPKLTSSYVYPLVYPVLQTNILERTLKLNGTVLLVNQSLKQYLCKCLHSSQLCNAYM
ncbi:predicted protein [Arabidopsis lyrata subsp. lyrata]|uniref:Predicted protein n=1 Tax=Arabidopsis lyrata subsp. lyrata TaxID=81972 RepID=D7M7Z6_ARALL|nr:predicted protein [Arabidopsis lyrata subsp. lyrata]